MMGARLLSVLIFSVVLSCAVSEHLMSLHMMNGDLPVFRQFSKKRGATCSVCDECVEFPAMGRAPVLSQLIGTESNEVNFV